VNSEIHLEAVVVGIWPPPLQSDPNEWVRDWVRVIAALHHAIDTVEKPSLDGIQHHNPEISPITHLICFLLLSFVS